MDLYGLLLFVHIAGVIAWVGSGVVFQVLAERAAGSNDPVRTKTLVDVGDVFGPAFFGILTLLVLVTGLWLVFEGNWGFDHFFILGGLIGLVASGAIGGAVLGRTAQRLAESLRGSTELVSGAQSHVTRLRNAGRLDMGIMIVVVFLMTVKPGS